MAFCGCCCTLVLLLLLLAWLGADSIGLVERKVVAGCCVETTEARVEDGGLAEGVEEAEVGTEESGEWFDGCWLVNA